MTVASERMVREVAAVIAASWSDGRVPAVTDEERVVAERDVALAELTLMREFLATYRRLLAVLGGNVPPIDPAADDGAT